MQHTYLRYECADAFSLTTSSSSTSTLTTSPITFLNNNKNNISNSKNNKNKSSILLSTAGSQIIGFNLRTNEPCLKIAHRELLSGGLGTGKALNSNEVLCITTTSSSNNNNNDDNNGSIYQVATGWKDGSIRIFEIYPEDNNHSSNSKLGMVHSLLFDNVNMSSKENEEFIMREPLVLNGHNNASVTCLAFDNNGDSVGDGGSGGANRLLASGSTDGRIILWDVIAESGLFRLIGHKGPITDLSFAYIHEHYDSNNASSHVSTTTSSSNDMVLISSSMDGLVKIWNMESQCCVQTIANHNGQVMCSSVLSIFYDNNKNNNEKDDNDGSMNIGCRSRFISGCIDGKVRVWSIHSSKRVRMESNNIQSSITTNANATAATTENEDYNIPVISDNTDQDDICSYMGTLPLPTNSISNEKIQSIKYYTCTNPALIGNNNHEQTAYVGILRSNTKYVDIYMVRSLNESIKKKVRRLRRKREKESSRQQKKDNDEQENQKSGGRGKKRGILDDEDENESSNEIKVDNEEKVALENDQIKASDEFEYVTTVRSSDKIKAFTFTQSKHKKAGVRIVLALATNALEVHAITATKSEQNSLQFETDLVSTLDMYGHPTGIRSIALSTDDTLACTVSKNMAKVWNVNNRSCLRSLPLSTSTFNIKSKKASFYGLCVAFLPGDSHFVVGTREGHLFIVDIASGEIVYFEENAHEKEIWSIDIKKPKPNNNFHIDENDDGEAITVMTGSADKSVKFWEIETQTSDSHIQDNEDDSDEEIEGNINPFINHPMLVHVRTLQSNDDVVACRYSYDPSKRMVFVSTLDSQIKVFFDDSLKFFLSLYGHSLPALALDASDDDVLLASGGADKSIKIWGLDFGDTHRTLYGHSDSITDLKFVKKTHNFFTCSKDSTVRYWDGDRFEQILLLNGHTSEINCLALSKSGAYVLSGGMDRQVRVWERTKDMVFLEEEKERELDAVFDKVDGREEQATAQVLRRNGANAEDEDDIDDNEDTPQSEAAVKKSVLSVSSGDRIMEALELADQEMKEIASFNNSQITMNIQDRKERSPNVLLMSMDPPSYILWVLRSIKSAEFEQSLLILTLNHVERLLYYLILLLRKGQGIEMCSRAAVFLIKNHQNQVIYGGSGTSKQKGSNMSVLLRELRRLLKLRLGEERDTIGYNIAAMRMILRVSKERKGRYHIPNENDERVDIWKDLAR